MNYPYYFSLAFRNLENKTKGEILLLFYLMIHFVASVKKKYIITFSFKFRRLAKSTLVLIPLFGVHYVIFLGLPDKDVEPEAEVIKLYFEMFLNSFQVSYRNYKL